VRVSDIETQTNKYDFQHTITVQHKVKGKKQSTADPEDQHVVK